MLFNIIDSELPFSIESIGYNWHQEYILRNNGYPYYHWLQTLSGFGKIEISGKTFLLKAGEGIFIAPFIPHRYISHSASPWYTNFITICGKLSPHIIDIIGSDSFYLAQDTSDFSFSEWIYEKENKIKDTVSSYTKTQFSMDAYYFLIQLKKSLLKFNENSDLLFTNYVHPALNYIHMHYAQPVSTKELASLVFISPQYLSRLFKRFTNLSPHQYLNAFRLKRAKELLVNDFDTPISKIALLVGFQDTSHFIMNFKKHTTFTPEQFRKSHYNPFHSDS
jgi:AraC-type DNA-binding domain-containing proteins